MKSLIEYINESKYFTLTPGERDALTIVIGNITALSGNDEDIDTYEEVRKEIINDDELNKLKELYEYVLSNNQDYPKINRNIIKDEIPILIKIFTYMDENDLGSFECTDILNKLTTK